MMKKELERLPIGNYYVGELCVSFPIPDINNDKNDPHKINEIDKTDYLNMNGAIYLGNDLNYIENNRYYVSYLVLFYNFNGRMICLNDKSSILNNNLNYYRGLTPLRDCLPPIDCNIPNYISVRDSKRLFDLLFKRSRFRSPADLYPWISNNKFLPSKYYLGNLSLYMGYKENGKYERSNIIPEYILKANGTKEGKVIEINDDRKVHIYKDFLCLFLCYQEQKVLNLYNNQYYKFGTINNELAEVNSVPIKESYYELMNSFNDYVINKGIGYSLYRKAPIKEVIVKAKRIVE
jgi:hypothetical protein